MTGALNGTSKYPTAFKAVQDVLVKVKARDPDQPEFHQAVEEVLLSLLPALEANPQYLELLPALVEPERQIVFRVPWVDRNGQLQINRGFRVQFNSAIGPYKGGLRFSPTVTLSIIKFLGFEQCFKNALTTLPMGGGKGGSDFDPKGKTDKEVMSFCQSFMTELQRHIGPQTDVPAGDIGVGGREIGFLFGQYKRLRNEFTGTLTGKGLTYGGSDIRTEATGYGAVYFGEQILADKGETFQGKRCLVSGSGNVATYAVEKLLHLGAIPLTVSDSSGTFFEPAGFTESGLAALKELKEVKRGRLSELNTGTGKFLPGVKPWALAEVGDVDVALPCATQNEIDASDAKALVAKGVTVILEGANMPSTNEAIDVFHSGGVIFAPAKAANAGGVAVSGLEMAQNSGMAHWAPQEVDGRLKAIMTNIYKAAKSASDKYGVTLQAGANIAGFEKVAKTMLAHGAV